MTLVDQILGHIVVNRKIPEEINVKFFETKEQRLVFNEAEKGNFDLPLLHNNLKHVPGMAVYLSEFTKGVHEIGPEGLGKLINRVKIDRLKVEIRKFLYSGLKTGHYDDDKLEQLYFEKRAIEEANEHSELISLNEVESKPINWLWHNKIPAEKLSLICGDPGEGKSIFGIYLASTISRGSDWPDTVNYEKNGKGPVIIFSAEDSIEDTIKVRAEAMNADCSKIKVFNDLISTSKKFEFFDIGKHMSNLEREIKESDDIKLIIFDPISAYLGSIDSNNVSQVRAALALIANFAEKHGITIIGITHLNKDSTRGSMYRTLGSIAFTAAARSVWLIKHRKNQSNRMRYFAPIKANLSKDPETLSFNIDGPLGNPKIEFDSMPVDITAEELLADVESQTRFSATKEAIRFISDMLKDGPLLAKEIINKAEECGISKRTLDRAKSELGIRSYQHDCQWLWSKE